jgi:hypothetical protein
VLKIAHAFEQATRFGSDDQPPCRSVAFSE